MDEGDALVESVYTRGIDASRLEEEARKFEKYFSMLVNILSIPAPTSLGLEKHLEKEGLPSRMLM